MPGARRAFGQFPLVVQQHVKVAVVPLGGVGGPGTFNTAGHCVAAYATGFVVVPAQALLFYIGRLRLWAQIRGAAIAVCFTHGVTTGGEGDSFFIVHRHACKSDANIVSGFLWIGITIHTFGVYINQAHHHCS